MSNRYPLYWSVRLIPPTRRGSDSSTTHDLPCFAELIGGGQPAGPPPAMTVSWAATIATVSGSSTRVQRCGMSPGRNVSDLWPLPAHDRLLILRGRRPSAGLAHCDAADRTLFIHRLPRAREFWHKSARGSTPIIFGMAMSHLTSRASILKMTEPNEAI